MIEFEEDSRKLKNVPEMKWNFERTQRTIQARNFPEDTVLISWLKLEFQFLKAVLFSKLHGQ